MVKWLYKTKTRRNVSLPKRDFISLSSIDVNKLRNSGNVLNMYSNMIKECKKHGLFNTRIKKLVFAVMKKLYDDIVHIVRIEEPKFEKKIRSDRKCIDDFAYVEKSSTLSFSDLFRFRSCSQLRELINGFKIPKIIIIKGSKFSNKEVLLISLIRLSYPHRWCDVLQYFPDRDRQECQKAFYFFLNFISSNWGYLITNNRSYWNKDLDVFSEAIRSKFAALPNKSYRQFFGDEEFNIFAFIDNTIIAHVLFAQLS